MTPFLYGRFSGFYFLYYAALGVFLPFWPLYWRSLGFSAVEIGQLMAVAMAACVVAPNVWGWLADHTGRRVPLVWLATLGGMVAALGTLWASDFRGMALLMLASSFFWCASLPLVEGLTLTHLERQATPRYTYMRVRAWGSTGFIFSCVILSTALFHAEADAMRLIPLGWFFCHFGLWLVSLTLTGRPQRREHSPHITLVSLIRHPPVLGLLAAFVLMQASHGPFYAFFSIYVEDHGYPIYSLAALWSVGVLGEIAVFLYLARRLDRYSARLLFAAAFFFAAVRWALLGNFPDLWPALLAAQLLHAVVYGTYHTVSMRLIHQLFPGRFQSRGQALYLSLNYGVGAALGSLISGALWEDFGPAATFHVAAAVALAGMLVGWLTARRAALRRERL